MLPSVSEIRFISAMETHPLRARVLRPGRPFNEAQFDCDHLPDCFHLGAFANENVPIGVATLYPETSPLWPKVVASFRLRGMAVDPAWRRHHIGRQLLLAAETEVLRRGGQLLWFNAREAAFPFYRACGYVEHSELFDIPGVGPHKVMMKRF